MELHGGSIVSTIKKSMGIYMDTHGNTMDFSWSVPWSYHGYLTIDHGFAISTMINPWNSHGFFMYFPWSIDRISSGGFEYGHRKDMGIP